MRADSLLLHARICAAADTLDLRRAVLRPGVANVVLPGDDQPGVVHLGVFDGDRAVAACLIYAEDLPGREGVGWRLRSMASDPTARGLGYGRSVLALAYTVAAGEGAELIWCHARHTAIGFYASDGWIGVGELFDEIDIPHLLMWRQLLAN